MAAERGIIRHTLLPSVIRLKTKAERQKREQIQQYNKRPCRSGNFNKGKYSRKLYEQIHNNTLSGGKERKK